MAKAEVKTASVRPCDCAHDYQDRTYGAGKRVHNACEVPDETGQGWRCSVCGNVVIVAGAATPVGADEEAANV